MKRLLELITDAGTGQLSTSKIGSIIGIMVISYGFILMVNADKMTDMIMLVYGAVVIGNATASKIVSMKYGVKKDELT